MHSFAKYDNPETRPGDSLTLAIAGDVLEQLLLPFFHDVQPYSWEDTIQSMDGSKAAGFPYNVYPLGHAHRGSKKATFLDDPSLLREVAGELWDTMENFDRAKAYSPSFDRRFNVWNVSQKMEILAAKKLKMNSTEENLHYQASRTITFPSMPLAFIEAAYQGAVESRYMRASKGDIRVGSFIGKTPFYGGIFSMMAAQPDGWVVQTSDLSGYDSTQHAALMAAETAVVVSLLSHNKNFQAVIEWINHVGTHSNTILPTGQVIRKSGGQCSGARNTSGGNTRRRWMLLLYCFIKLVPALQPLDFFKYVICFIMGDDDLVYVHPDIADAFSTEARTALLWTDFGIQQKLDEKDSPTLEGHSFVGYAFCRSPLGIFEPCFDAGKIIYHAAQSLKKETPAMFFGRMNSLAIMSKHVHLDGVWRDGREVYAMLRSLAFGALEPTGEKPPHEFIPYDHVTYLWTGQEAAGPQTPEEYWTEVKRLGLFTPQGARRPLAKSKNKRSSSTSRCWTALFIGLLVLLGAQNVSCMAAENPVSSSVEYFDPAERASTNDVASMDRTFKRDLPDLSKKGRDWMKAALDPFHDTVESVEGYPDPKGGYSIQLCVKKTISVTKPKSLPAGSTWDCHMVMTGLTQSMPVKNGAITLVQGVNLPKKTQGTSPVSGVGTFGTITIVSELSGKPTMPSFTNNPNFTTSQTLEIQDVSVIDSSSDFQATDGFLDGRARVNYGGFEVVNTTPALYRGGAVTAYSQMGSSEQQFFAEAASDCNPHYVQSAPPPTSKKAMLLQGARQWGADKGAYLVGEFATGDLPGHQPAASGFMLLGGDWAPGVLAESTPGVGTLVNNYWSIDTVKSSETVFLTPAAFTGKGLYFTGLHENTTLQVNARFGVEMFPTEKDEIAMLASSMSPRYDPAPITAYQQVLFSMPPAVPLDENFTGEWFKNIVGTIGRVAPSVLRTVAAVAPHPGVKAAAAAGSQLIDAFNKGKKSKGKVIASEESEIARLKRIIRELREEKGPRKLKNRTRG